MTPSDRPEVEEFLRDFHKHFEITDEEQRPLIRELAHHLYNKAKGSGQDKQRLTALKEEVENHLFFADFDDEKIEAGYDKGIKRHKEYVLTLIEEELQ